MAKKNRPKKSKALVVWAIVTVIVLLADCVGNYLVVGLPGNMNSLLDKPMAAIGEAIDFKLSAGELGGLMDTLFGSLCVPHTEGNEQGRSLCECAGS